MGVHGSWGLWLGFLLCVWCALRVASVTVTDRSCHCIDVGTPPHKRVDGVDCTLLRRLMEHGPSVLRCVYIGRRLMHVRNPYVQWTCIWR